MQDGSRNIFANINDRLQKLLEYSGLSAYAFEKKTGIPNGSLGKMLRGEHRPSLIVIEKLLTAFDELSLEWLLQGKGEMIKKKTSSENEDLLEKYKNDAYLNAYPDAYLPAEKSVKSGRQEGLNVQSRPPLVVTVDSSGRELISMVAARALASYVTSNHEQNFINELPAFSLPLPEFSRGTFRAFQSASTSMEPTIYNGEWLIGLYLDNWPQNILESQIYIIVTAETIFIRRVLNRIDTRNHLVLLSDNDIFPTEILEPNHIREIWHVKAKIGFNFHNLGYDIHRKISNLEAEIEHIKSQLGRS